MFPGIDSTDADDPRDAIGVAKAVASLQETALVTITHGRFNVIGDRHDLEPSEPE